MDQQKYGITSRAGRDRSHNEDSCRADPRLGLYIVADGMGGHEGGEKASSLAADFIIKEVRAGLELSTSVARAHHAVKQAAARGMGPKGMGTTVVALQIIDHICEISWVGDCRAYIWDGQELRQLTRDHSYVQHLVDTGVISADESEKHPYQDILIQALGAEDMDDVAVDELVEDLCRNEQILLCSDGLIKGLDESAIIDILELGCSEQEKADALVEAALKKGGKDDITAVLVSAEKNAPVRYTGEDTVAFLTQNLIPPGFIDKMRHWWRRVFKRS
ncbi:MAG: protein phosphatase 2C domain-containing protein [Desulfosalsimonadaceae bacterium]